MKGDFRQVFLEIVEQGILNKYSWLAPRQVVAAFNSTWSRILEGPNEKSVVAELRKICTPEDDINNQVVILQLAERFWAKPPRLDFPLTTFNSASFGSIDRVQYRSSDFVADYGSEIRIQKGEVVERLDELERLCRHTVTHMTLCSIEERALQLAYIHGALIRIHPFEDGNGRTARLFIQYALLAWGLIPTPLPKVRNDPNWSHAMNQAVEGNAGALQQQLVIRIRKANGM